jgi:hypothetical protein
MLTIKIKCTMKNDDDKIKNTNNGAAADDNDHKIPDVGEVKEGHDDESQFEEPVASPNVAGEESIGGSAPIGEPQDIDQALADLGLENDSEGVKPLSSDDIDY